MEKYIENLPNIEDTEEFKESLEELIVNMQTEEEFGMFRYLATTSPGLLRKVINDFIVAMNVEYLDETIRR